MILRALLVLALIVLGACTPHGLPSCKIGVQTTTDTDYHVTVTGRTPKGAVVDFGDCPWCNPAKVDRVEDELEACVEAAWGSPPTIPDDVLAKAHCVTKEPGHFPRGCVVVKLLGPGFYHVQQDDYGGVTDQVLDQTGPCDKPGAVPPCYRRAGFQYGPDFMSAVSPPAMRLAKAPLLRAWLGCSADFYADPTLAACANPSPTTEANRLDDGRGPLRLRVFWRRIV